MRRIGYATDKLQVAGDSIKAFCPIHRDTRFRSLLVDCPKHTFKCTIKTCPGYAGGTLVDLFALSRQVDTVSASLEIVGALDLPVDPSWSQKLAATYFDEAERAFVRHDHEAAETAARKSLEFQPNVAQVRLLLANLYTERGQTTRACEEFVNVIENDLSSASYEEADRILDHASTTFPDNEDLMFLRIRSAELQGQNERTLQLLQEIATRRDKAGRGLDNIGIYEKLSELRPDDTGPVIKLADLYELRRDIKRANKEREKAVHILITQHRNAEAIPLLERILQFEPDLTRLRVMLGEQLVHEGEYPRAKQQFLEIINLQLEQNDMAAAAETARRWLEIEPESIEIRESLARIYQEQGRGDEACSELRLASEMALRESNVELSLELLFRVKFLKPDDIELRRQIVQQLMSSGQTARAAFELLDIGEALFAQGNETEAEVALGAAASVGQTLDLKLHVASLLVTHSRPTQARELYVSLIQAAETEEAWETALTCCDELLKLDPDNLEIESNRCRVLWSMGQRGNAAQATVQLLPKFVAAGDHAGALQVLGLASQHNIDNLVALRQLFDFSMDLSDVALALRFYTGCKHQLRSGDASTILEMARRILGLDPQNEIALLDSAEIAAKIGQGSSAADAYISLSRIEEARERFPEAVHYVEMAMAADVERPDLLKQKAALLLSSGKTQEARDVQFEYLRVLKSSGQSDKLLQEYQEFLSRNPGESLARREYAVLLVEREQLQQAQEQYQILLDEAEAIRDQKTAIELRERLLALDAGNVHMMYELGSLLCSAGEREKALPLLTASADAFLATEDFSSAATAARTALELGPDDADLWEKLATAERRRNNIKAFEACLDKLTGFGRPRLELEWLRENTLTAVQDNRLKKAEEYAQRWVKLAPEDAEAWGLMARIYSSQKRTHRAVEAYLSQASLLRSSTDYQHAVQALRLALEIEHEDLAVRQLLWQMLLEWGKEEEALVEMQQLADLLVERRDYKEATTLLSRILEYRTNSVSTLRRLASLIFEYEGFAKAFPYFRKLLSVRKESASVAEVSQDYEAVLRLEGADVDLRIEYAEFLDGAGEQAAAKAQLLNIAQIYRDELSDPVRAIQFFGRATSVAPCPEDARVFEELASLHMSLNVPDFAAEALREAVRLYENQRDTDRALAASQRLVAIPGPRFDDLVHLGDLLATAGKQAEAADAYRQALAHTENSGTTSSRRVLCEKLIECDPLDFDCASELIMLLPIRDVAKRSLAIARHFKTAGKRDQLLKILEQAKTSVPADIALRREIIGYFRTQGEPGKMREELADLCRIAAQNHQKEAARQALDELVALPPAEDNALQLAPLYMLCEDSEHAVACYCEAALDLVQRGEFDQAASALRSALDINTEAVQASSIADLVRQSHASEVVCEIALQYLDNSLSARNRTRSLVVGTALLEFGNDDDVQSILTRIHKQGGADFIVAIGGTHAEWLHDKDRAKEALAVVDFVSSIASSSPDAWWLAAQMHRKCGDTDLAATASLKAAKLYASAGAVTEEETCYRETLEDSPDNAPVLETLALFYLRERRIPDAIGALRKLSALAQNLKDLPGAANWLRKALGADADNEEIREELIELLIKLGQVNEAVEELLNLAQSAISHGLAEKAAIAYERVLVLEAGSEPAIRPLLDLALESGNVERISRYSHMLADTIAEAGDLKQAMQILRELLEKDPDNLRALEKLISLSQRTHDNRSYCSTLSSLAHKLAKHGEYSKAVTHLEALLKERPGEEEILELLMDCCIAEGLSERASECAVELLGLARLSADPERIRKSAQSVLSFDEENADAHRACAEALVQLGQNADAVSEWRRSSDILRKNKELTQAAACLKQITELDSSDTQAWQDYADVVSEVGETADARDAYLRLAELWQATGQKAEVEKAIVSALIADPDSLLTHEKALHFCRGFARPHRAVNEILWLVDHHLRSGDFAASEALIQEGARLDPENDRLLELRIEVIEKLGRREELHFRLRELSQRYASNKDYGRAAELLERLRGLVPGLIDVRRELAGLRLKLGDEALALQEYFEIVTTLLENSETEEARESAEKLLDLAPKNIQLRARVAGAFAQHGAAEIAGRHYLACANLAAQAGNAADHIDYLQFAVNTRPRWVEPMRLLADACATAGRKEEAARAYERLEEVLLGQKQFPEAIEALKHHIALLPNEPEPRKKLADLYGLAGDKEERSTQLRGLADLFSTRGEIDQAVDAYRQLVTLHPDDISILQRFIELFAQIGNELEIVDEYVKLAEAYTRKGAFVEATRSYEHVLSMDRRNTGVREKFVAFLLDHGQKSRATVEMKTLAETYQALGDHSAAVRIFERLLALNPGDWDLRVALAEAQGVAGDPKGALATFAVAAEQCERQDITRAITIYHMALKAAPEDIDLRRKLGECLVRAGDRKRAAENARSLAEIYSARGEYDLAEAAYSKASEYDPETKEMLHEMLLAHAHDPGLQYLDYIRYGDRLAELGEIDAALAAYCEARGLNDERPELIQKYIDALVQIAPEHAAINEYLSLAQSYQASGQKKQAADVYAHILRLDPTNQAAAAGKAEAER